MDVRRFVPEGRKPRLWLTMVLFSFVIVMACPFYVISSEPSMVMKLVALLTSGFVIYETWEFFSSVRCDGATLVVERFGVRREIDPKAVRYLRYRFPRSWHVKEKGHTKERIGIESFENSEELDRSIREWAANHSVPLT